MKITKNRLAVPGVLAAGAMVFAASAMAEGPKPRPAQDPPGSKSSQAPAQPSPQMGKGHGDVDKILRTWPAGPQLAAHEMMAKYGAPQEVTSERMIWHDAGPFAMISLTKEQLPHDFPLPHMDYLEHTILYDVPTDKVDEVQAFDGSITVYPVGGTLSARCDLESNNVLTLNLAKDVISGKKSVTAARKQFGDLVMQRTLGKSPAYTTALQFKPQDQSVAADIGKVTIPGAPTRVQEAGKATQSAEILGMLIATDLDEVHAAMTAQHKEDLRGPVAAYAKTLHQEHGKNVQKTAQLGMKMKVTPAQTPEVRELHEKHAAALATIVPLQGEAFSRAFLDNQITMHTQAMQMIDRQLEATDDQALEAHLKQTRQAISSHLAQAKQLQGDLRPQQTSARK